MPTVFCSSIRALALLFVVSPLLAATPEHRANNEQLATDGGAVRLIFDRDVLAGFGFELASPDTDVLLHSAPPSSFVVSARGGDFEGIVGGRLRTAGTLALLYRGQDLTIDGLEIVPGSTPLGLELRDLNGRQVFFADHPHFHYDPIAARLKLEHVDLRISNALAARLARPDLEGIAIARLELEAATSALGASAELGDPCLPTIYTGEVDVALANISSVQQMARSGGQVAIAPSALLRNVGESDAVWQRKFTGAAAPYGTDQHPYLAWAIFRIAPISGDVGSPTAIRMLANSPLKQAFFATNTSCTCEGAQVLFAAIRGEINVGQCEDLYSAGTNDDSNALGPRDELEAHTGLWESTGSFFDQDSNGVCDWDTAGSPGGDCGNLPRSSTFDRRMAVVETDLETEDATYFVDSWYLVRDDIDIFNTMGWRRVTPSLSEPNWSFGLATSLALGSVLDAWVSRTSPPAGASHVRLDTGIGELSLAAQATDLGEGQWHYEYALHNHDFDRKVQSFRVPLPNGVVATNAVFRGLGNGGAADWTTSIGADAVSFTAPADANVNALDWGTLFSFGFDADAAPASGSVDLGALEQTPDLRFAGSAVTPGGALGSALFADDFESAGSARWSSTEG